MASRSFLPWLRELTEGGYLLHLVFLWLSSPETAIARVRTRVRMGGHDVPEDTIRRRYERGIRNFLGLYRPLATTWSVYDSSSDLGPRLVAKGGAHVSEEIIDEHAWEGVRSS